MKVWFVALALDTAPNFHVCVAVLVEVKTNDVERVSCEFALKMLVRTPA